MLASSGKSPGAGAGSRGASVSSSSSSSSTSWTSSTRVSAAAPEGHEAASMPFLQSAVNFRARAWSNRPKQTLRGSSRPAPGLVCTAWPPQPEGTSAAEALDRDHLCHNRLKLSRSTLT